MTARRTGRAPEVLLLEIAERLPRLFFKLKAVTDGVWAPLEITSGERAVLVDLLAGEPMTAPQLAALRPISRQAIQPVLASLLERELVAPVPNPRKRRSPFHRITAKGRRLLDRGRAREVEELADVGGGFAARELQITLDVLLRVEAVLANRLAEKDA